jgi:type VI secretion system secreted protein VgrG
VITAGGSQLKIDGSGVFPTTSGKFEVKAGQHVFKGGEKVSTKKITLPNPPPLDKNIGKFFLYKGNGSPFIEHEYKILDKEGNILKQGITNQFGETDYVQTEQSEKITYDVKILKEAERISSSWQSQLEGKYANLLGQLDQHFIDLEGVE